MLKKLIFLPCLLAAVALQAQQRPIVQTKFTADPAPIVVDSVVYLFVSHDADDAPEGMAAFKMRDWLLYSSADLVNWTDHGSVVDLSAFSWLSPEEQANGAWALQVVQKGDMYYMYAPVHMHGIGVLVSDDLYGPWTDPLGRPLISADYDSIDPTVLVDDDGSAYLYWGNPNLWYVKLNDDMISYSGTPHKDAKIRKTEGETSNFDYQEGPWIFKRHGKYYLAYASTCCPEGIGWAWSDKPFDNWTYGGVLMDHDSRSSGNHPGICDFLGNTYCFGFNYYLNSLLTDKHHERRSVCLTQLLFNPDGSIQQCPWWEEGVAVAPVQTFYPYERVEAETMAWSKGVKTKYVLDSLVNENEDGSLIQVCQNPDILVTDIDDGDYTMVRAVDLGVKGAKKIEADIACSEALDDKGSKIRKQSGIEVHIDSINGKTIAVLQVPKPGKTRKCSLGGRVKGVHDLYFVFRGEGYDFDWWRMIPR